MAVGEKPYARICIKVEGATEAKKYRIVFWSIYDPSELGPNNVAIRGERSLLSPSPRLI